MRLLGKAMGCRNDKRFFYAIFLSYSKQELIPIYCLFYDIWMFEFQCVILCKKINLKFRELKKILYFCFAKLNCVIV